MHCSCCTDICIASLRVGFESLTNECAMSFNSRTYALQDKTLVKATTNICFGESEGAVDHNTVNR